MITLVTSNEQKAFEIQRALQAFSIKVKVRDLDIPEIKALSIEEVVIAKAEAAYQAVGGPVLVDDTGIFFQGYKNFPGAYSKFAIITLGFAGIFKLIKSKQPAKFCSYLAYKTDKYSAPRLFVGVCRGHLIKTLRGKRKKKMPYDNIFIPQGETKTFAELGVAGKQKYDHRSKATRLFARYYLKQLV